MTIGAKWFYNRYDTQPRSYSELLRNLIDISHKGGNFLLNVGPDSQGRIPGYAVDRLQRMGEWLRVNGESIYGTVAGPWTAAQIPWGRATRKGNRLYLHVFDWPADGTLEVPLASTVTGARLLAAPTTALTTSAAGGQVVINVPATAPDPVASVIILDYSGTLTNGNSAPVAVDGNAVSTAGAAADLSLRTLASDDITATTSLVFTVSNAIGGTVALQPDGHTARFTPTPGFTGEMSYTFTAKDAGNLTSPPATVRISEPVVTRNWTSASTGNWSTAGNWNPASTPVSGRGTQLSFFSGLTVPGAARSFTQDIATPLRLNKLALTGTGASGANLTLDGNGLEFVRNGATLPVIDLTCTGGVATYTVTQPITLSADTTFNGPNSATHIFSGPISGPGGLTRTGEYASLILTANNTYTGPTKLLGGTTQIGNGGTTGSLGSGPVTLNGSLTISRSNALDLTQPISGFGSILHNGSGTTTLGASNSFSGSTTVYLGTLVASSLNSHNNGVPPLATSSLGAPISPLAAVIAPRLQLGQRPPCATPAPAKPPTARSTCAAPTARPSIMPAAVCSSSPATSKPPEPAARRSRSPVPPPPAARFPEPSWTTRRRTKPRSRNPARAPGSSPETRPTPARPPFPPGLWQSPARSPARRRSRFPREPRFPATARSPRPSRSTERSPPWPCSSPAASRSPAAPACASRPTPTTPPHSAVSPETASPSPPEPRWT